MAPAEKQRVFVALGGNQGDVTATFGAAVRSLVTYLGEPSAVSSCYETRALTTGNAPQGNYVNAVVEFRSALSPADILGRLLEVERSLGRDRSAESRWGPRIIDLDLLFVGTAILRSETLTIPHPELTRRDFVLVPLAEIAGDFAHPELGTSMSELASSLEQRGHERFVLKVLSGPEALEPGAGEASCAAGRGRIASTR